MDPSDFAVDFNSALDDLAQLNTPVRTIIHSLTEIAGENKHEYATVVELITNRINQGNTTQQLNFIYLMDSIVKNIKGVYVSAFASHLETLFCCAWDKADISRKKKLQRVFFTWSTAFASHPTQLAAISHNCGHLLTNPASLDNANLPQPPMIQHTDFKFYPQNVGKEAQITDSLFDSSIPPRLRHDNPHHSNAPYEANPKVPIRHRAPLPSGDPFAKRQKVSHHSDAPPQRRRRGHWDQRYDSSSRSGGFYENSEPLRGGSLLGPPPQRRADSKHTVPLQKIQNFLLHALKQKPEPSRGAYKITPEIELASQLPPQLAALRSALQNPSGSNARLISQLSDELSAEGITVPQSFDSDTSTRPPSTTPNDIRRSTSNPIALNLSASELVETLVKYGLLPAGSHSTAQEKSPTSEIDIPELGKLYDNKFGRCQQCGIRHRKKEDIGPHLDWHYQDNKEKQDRLRTAVSRKWFPTAHAWSSGDYKEGFEQSLMSFFGVDESHTEATENVNQDCIPMDDDQDSCGVCGELLEQFWDENKEEWMYRDVRIIGSEKLIVHVRCMSDYKEPSKKEEEKE